MDRIFRNKLTGKILISTEKGFMPIDNSWEQIGTIDVKKLNFGRDFQGEITVK